MKKKKSTSRSNPRKQKSVPLPSVKAVTFGNYDFDDVNTFKFSTELALEGKRNFEKQTREALEANDYSRYLYLHPEVFFPVHPLLKRKVRLEAFVDIHERLTPEQYWPLLVDVWMGEKIIHPNFDLWIRLFEIHPPQLKDDLPETMTVYRGCNGHPGLSWSLSKSIAQGFADRAGNGVVIEGTVQRQDICFYTNERGEQEVVVNPDCVRILSSPQDQTK